MNWSDVTPKDGLRVVIIGGDLSNSLLPGILDAGLAGTGSVLSIECVVEEFEFAANHLRECGVRGIAVAAPHKAQAARLAQRYFTSRTAVGVANMLRFEPEGTYGLNTEAPAIVSLVSHVEPTNALVMGSGSGARSVAAALLEADWHLRVWARNGMRARLLQTTFGRYGKLDLLPQADPNGCRLIVNATALGARAGEKPPVNWTNARAGSTALDLVYRRVPTEFLREASMRGFKTIDGRQIVVEKAALGLEWMGIEVDRKAMLLAAGLRVPA